MGKIIAIWKFFLDILKWWSCCQEWLASYLKSAHSDGPYGQIGCDEKRVCREKVKVSFSLFRENNEIFDLAAKIVEMINPSCRNMVCFLCTNRMTELKKWNYEITQFNKVMTVWLTIIKHSKTHLISHLSPSSNYMSWKKRTKEAGNYCHQASQ